MEGIVVDKNSLCFMIPKEGMISSDKVKVRNLCEQAVVYRVKTNDRYRFNVRPRNGIIQAQASAEIEIVFNGFTAEDEYARGQTPRLRLDVAPLPPKAVGIEAKEFWKTRDAIFKRGESNTMTSYPLYKYYFNIELIDFHHQSNSSLILGNRKGSHLPDEKSGKELEPSCTVEEDMDAANEDDVVRMGRKTIVFPCLPSDGCTSLADTILLENDSNTAVTFRVRSTDPKMFLAKPNNGLIFANDSIDIACIYNSLNATRKQRSGVHYFQVDVADSIPNNASRFWAAFDMKLIQSTVYTLLFKVEFQKGNNNNIINSSKASRFVGDDSPSFFNLSRSFKNLKLDRTLSRLAPPATTSRTKSSFPTDNPRYNNTASGYHGKSLASLSLKKAPRCKTTDLTTIPRHDIGDVKEESFSKVNLTNPRCSSLKKIPFYEKELPHPWRSKAAHHKYYDDERPSFTSSLRKIPHPYRNTNNNNNGKMGDDDRPSLSSRVFKRDSRISSSRPIIPKCENEAPSGENLYYSLQTKTIQASASRVNLNYAPRSKTTDLRFENDTHAKYNTNDHLLQRSMSNMGSGVGLRRTPNHHTQHNDYEEEQDPALADRKYSTRKNTAKMFRRTLGGVLSNWRRR